MDVKNFDNCKDSFVVMVGLSQLIGNKRILPAGKCDVCGMENTACRKVYVSGLGELCFCNKL